MVVIKVTSDQPGCFILYVKFMNKVLKLLIHVLAGLAS